MSTPEFADTATAEAAFMSSFDQPAEQAPEAPPEAPNVEATEDIATGTTSQEDSGFRGFDENLLTTLPPELQEAVKAERASMQGDYTRKTQEAAALRKQYEGLDPELARQSVEYIQALSNPEFLQQAHSAMAAELEKLGLSPAQASAQATANIAEQVPDYEDDEGFNPRIENELNELKAWKNQIENERRETYMTNEILKQETALRQGNPDYTDENISHIMSLAWSTGGDLIKANSQYQQMQQFFAKQLLDTKSSSNGAVAPPPASGGGTTPTIEKYGSLDEAHAAAQARLRYLQSAD